MSTLILRLAAPMQSWGIESKFDLRNTGRMPSKSGVIGLCACALGYRRDEDEKIAKLSALKIGVRIDRPGVLIKDFHTARSEKSAYVTTRYYLSDAAFLVGIEGDYNFMHEIDAAVCAPAFPLFLGRRCCPPEGRVSFGVVEDDLKDALEKQPSITGKRFSKTLSGGNPRIVIDTDADGFFIRDLPRSFDPKHRRFDFRQVYEYESGFQTPSSGGHDALAELEAFVCT